MSNKFGNGGLGSTTYAPGPGNYNTSGDIARNGTGATMGAKYGSSKLLN